VLEDGDVIIEWLQVTSQP